MFSRSRIMATLAAAGAIAGGAVAASPASAQVPGQSSCVAFFVTNLPVEDVVYIAQNTPALGDNGKVFFAQQKTNGLC